MNRIFEKYSDEIEKVKEIDNKTNNIFKILKQETMENKHSTFLSWLLNPFASHGYGAKFSQMLFDKAFENDGPIPDAEKIEYIRNEVQISGESQKEQNKDKKRIDILIVGRNFTCTIENKYGSRTHGGQCADYKEYISEEYKRFGENNKFIFLDIEEPYDFKYEHETTYASYDLLLYKDILGILNLLLKDNSGNEKTKLYIEQYRDILEEKYGYNSNDEYKAIYDEIAFEDIIDLTEISATEYDDLPYEQKRFVDEAVRYYGIKKTEFDRKILNNLKAISKDKFYIKSNYGRKKKGDEKTKYSHTIPVSIDVMGDVNVYLFNKGLISEKELYLSKLKEGFGDDEKDDADKHIKQEKDLLKKEKGNKGSRNIPFQTIDFRAPMYGYKNITMSILAGFVPNYSKYICGIIDSVADNIIKLSDEWDKAVSFDLRTGAGSSHLINKNITVEVFNRSVSGVSIRDLFDIRFMGKTMDARSIFSDEFWKYVEKVDKCIVDDGNKLISNCLINTFLYRNEDKMKESNAVINEILSNTQYKNEYDRWKNAQNIVPMDYSILYDALNIKDEETKNRMKLLIENNYGIVDFKKWMETKIKNSPNKNVTDIDKELLDAINVIIDRYNQKIIEDSGKKRNKKNEDKIILKNYEYILELIDQRNNKEIIPCCYIEILYEMKNEEKLKEHFYDKSIEGANVFGKEWGDWLKNYIYIDRNDPVFNN